MGIVVKQSIQNSVFLFAGVALGALNILVLFPLFLSPEILGLTRVLVDISVLCASLATFGMPSVLVKFMPAYRDENRFEPGLLNLVLKYSVVGYVLVVATLILIEPYLVGLYSEKSPLLSEYFYLVPLLLFFTVLNQILSELCKSLFNSVYQTFVNELLIRLFVTILILGTAASLIGIHEFIIGYVLAFGVGSIALVIHLRMGKNLDMSPFRSKTPGRIIRLLKYGTANFLTTLSGSLASRFDSIMIVSLVPASILFKDSLEAAGIYAFALYVASMITIPGRGMISIALPVVSKAWEDNDMKNLSSVYTKTALNQLIFGGFIFVVIWLNIDAMLAFVPKFAAGKWVVLMLAISKLINVAFGVNTGILVTSKYYFVATLSLILLTILVLAGNYALIPIYGIEGAAFSTLVAVTIVQVLTYLFIWIKFKMQPFNLKTLIVLALLLLGFILGDVIPDLAYPFWDSLVRTGVTTTCFFVLILVLNVSPEVNSLFRRVVQIVSRK